MGVEWDVCHSCKGAFNDHQKNNHCEECGSIQCGNCTECQECEDNRINALCCYCKLVHEIEYNSKLDLLYDMMDLQDLFDACKDNCECGASDETENTDE